MAASARKKNPSRQAAGKKAAARGKTASGSSGTRAAGRADKSVEDFRESLERSLTLSRDRLQEVVDDAVDRGRMTRKDANDLVTKLVRRGRKQTRDLLNDLEKALDQARKEVEARARKARTRARRGAERAGKRARDVADEPLAQADKLRRRAGAGGFPVTAYDELTAAQVKSRVGDLTKADARKVRTYEKNHKARKSILEALDKRLA
jgi:polyhydroxyalkanoate synthesis regulator phasin